MGRLHWGAALAGAALLASSAAEAKVVRIEVESRAPIAGSFGSAGPYELISGRFFGELDPRDPKNAIITDLKLAPRNARGMVEYSATFQLAKPVDMAKASGFLFYSVPNRGRGAATGDPEGHVRLVSGWQGDIPPARGVQSASVPHAKGVTGPVMVRFTDMPRGAASLPIVAGLGGGVPQSHPASMDPAKARLIRRRSDTEAGVAVAAADFAFADCTATPFPGKPDPARLCVRGGFDPAYAYELAYVAKEPPVLGVGFAVTRDLNTFMRYAAGTAAAPNPVAGQVKWAIAVGVSQSGNYLRSFLNLGFNQGEDGRIVFDGMNPQIAGRHVPLNVRFAVPGGAAGLYEPGSEGVLWWGRYADKARGLPAASLLDRCSATRTCPKIFETFGSSEFWGLRMSPNLVGTDARADIPLPANVRRYYFPSVTHGGGSGGFALVARNAPGSGGCVLPANPNPTSEQLRALTRALQDWVSKGAAPPPSVYPTLAHGDLVLPTSQHLGFPTIPGAPAPDGHFNAFTVYDFGPTYLRKDVSGVMGRVPPAIVGPIPSLVPKVDADGNETSGLKSVHAMVPLGTYLGWNVQAGGYFAGKQCGFTGGYIPFANTRAERLAAGDPRPSLEERYGTHGNFVTKVREAAAQLVAGRYLLAEDAARIVGQAEASQVLQAR
jgi:hypothetical protein